MQEKIQKLKKWIDASHHIVFFGGAGVSTESGIPDFRSKDGLYHQTYQYPPESILSASFFHKHTDEFYRFYKDKMNSLSYAPNITHQKLTQLEQQGKLDAIITQNIDGLHQKAGSTNVLELHGSILRNYCMNCHQFYHADAVFQSPELVPTCSCGGIIKPDVVLYEENLDDVTLEHAIKAIQRAEMLIIGGTSLTVFPASSLIYYFKGRYLVLINQDTTLYDTQVDLLIQDKLGNVFQQL